jgi:hypothetical protein
MSLISRPTVREVQRRCEQRGIGRWDVVLSYASPYARRAFESEVEAVATAPEGMRNHRLFVACSNLIELCNGGELPHPLVLDALWTAAIRAGLGATEIERTMNSAVRKVAGKARTTPPRRGLL